MVPEPRSAYALQFFLLSTALLAAAAVLSFALFRTVPDHASMRSNQFSAAFIASTMSLFAGSACLFGAIASVRRERQKQFRAWLRWALTWGTLFVGIQTFAIFRLIRQQPADEAETGAAAFVAVFAGLHGMHFIVAFLFLSYVTVQAFADRYDHEYYWGVTICAWFWHALGIAWTMILFVMFTARFFA